MTKAERRARVEWRTVLRWALSSSHFRWQVAAPGGGRRALSIQPSIQSSTQPSMVSRGKLGQHAVLPLPQDKHSPDTRYSHYPPTPTPTPLFLWNSPDPSASNTPMSPRVLSLLGLSLLAAATGRAQSADTVFVEAESLASSGGWKLDTAFTNIVGSPYLLAHGLG